VGEIFIAQLIPLVAIVSGIGMVIVTVVAKHRRQVREIELRHRERMAAIEKGLDPPGDPVVAQPQPSIALPPRNGGSRYLLRGLIWLGVGLAIAFSDGGWIDRFHTYGWIASAVGAAHLVFYFVEGRRSELPPPDGRPRGDGSQL
jgi:hypothetical protein